jgi:hypothetical protein
LLKVWIHIFVTRCQIQVVHTWSGTWMLPNTTDFTEICTNKREFRLPPRSSWELRSSGLLRSD